MLDYVGRDIPRNDGWDKATGKGMYTEDIYLPNMLFAKVLRSPYAHAKVLKIDTSEAEALPGVKAVVTYENTPNYLYNTAAPMVTTVPGMEPVLDQTTFTNEPLYIGDEIAAVAATTEKIAEEAIKLIKIEYEELPAVYDPIEALKDDAPLVNPRSVSPEGGHTKNKNICGEIVEFQIGDVEKGFEAADKIVEVFIELPRVKQCQLEVHGAVATYKNGFLEVISTTQVPHPTKMILAKGLGLKESKIRVANPPYVGGGFGVRIGISGKAEFIAALLAMKAKLPVKYIYTREEDFLTSDTRHGGYLKTKLGATKDGKFVAISTTSWLNTGAYCTFGVELLGVAGACGTAGTYHIPNLHYKGHPVYTNQQNAGAFRGFGTPQGTAIVEAAVDKMAQELGMDLLEIRKLNTRKLEDGSGFFPFPVGSIGINECIDKAAEEIGWSEKRGKPQTGNIRKGVGLACGTHVSNASPFCVDYNAVYLKVEQDGTLVINSGIPEIGPGSTTALIQVACDLIGAPFETTIMKFGDTDTTPFDIGSHATRTLYTVSQALEVAAKILRKDIFEKASVFMEVPPEELNMRKGVIFGGGKELTLEKLAYDMHLRGHQFLATSCKVPPNSLPWHAQAAEVEVDMETGMVKVLKVAAAHDVGKAVNPVLCRGQIEGGVAMGVGYALREEMTYIDGKGFYNDGFHKYMLPTMDDCPEIVSILVESNDPAGTFGIKGVGECGVIPTLPAIFSAVEDAIGIRFEEAPLTPGRVLKKIKEVYGN
ncbi:MAG: molybdopterin-dependent oxidoreductase [Clostridiaceae bacterium]